jgi:Cu2+-exporting ATPase
LPGGGAIDAVAIDGRSETAADAAPATTTLVVDGMHCGHCMRTVETTLAALPGVIAARVNLSSKRVAVMTRGAPLSPEPFLRALEARGFPATVLVDQSVRPAAVVDHAYLKRLGVAGFAAANIMLLSVAVWSGHAHDMPASLQTLFHWLSALIALPAIAYAGQPFFVSARQAIAGGRLNMDVPISLGVTLATAMSVFQTIRGTEHVYFDAAITLLFFLLVGRALDHSVRARAASAAENLLGRRAATATVIAPDGTPERIAIGIVRPGMRIAIGAGEQIPVDGTLQSPAASIDESIVTGESRPRAAVAGDQVYAGTVALTGPLEIVATAKADNSLLADIARLMQTAEQARGRYVRLADRAARLYAPAVHVLGAVTFVGWMMLGAGWESSLTAAIAVLIITCPCALALAVPVVQVVATSRLFRAGVVVKAADALERFAEVDAVVLDKTGTLTLGRAELVADAHVPDPVLATAAGLAALSRHPYAQAVVRAAKRRGLAVTLANNAREVAGSGVEAEQGGRVVRLGSARFCDVPAGTDETPSLWFRDGLLPAVPLPLADAIRPDAKPVLAVLTRRMSSVEIVSGDTVSAVSSIARDLGIAQWQAGRRPADKIARIEALKASGRRVLMIGDGLNDAPALAAGHASVSPSSAADISQMEADAVFQGDGLGPVLTLLDVAAAARRRALENFAIAIGYNVVFVPLAMAGRVTPLIAAIAMSGSSIAVTLNALRIKGGKSREVGT